MASSFPFSLEGERKRFLFCYQSHKIHSIPFLHFSRDHLRSTLGITCGRGPLGVHFGDHLRSRDHLQYCTIHLHINIWSINQMKYRCQKNFIYNFFPWSKNEVYFKCTFSLRSTLKVYLISVMGDTKSGRSEFLPVSCKYPLNLGRPKLEFGSSHKKFEVWPRP